MFINTGWSIRPSFAAMPSYFQADMGHYGGYTVDDFERLLQLLTTLKGKFMLSSYPSDILSRHAHEAGWRMMEIELPRSAGGGRKVEVLTINYDVNENIMVSA